MNASPPTAKRSQGRPPLNWLTLDGIRRLPVGVAVTVQLHGTNTFRVVDRITATDDTSVQLQTPRGPVTLLNRNVKRARVVSRVFEAGDPVVRVGVDATTWRGGVVRTDGHEVMVEQIDGSFAWFPESDLEPADVRDVKRPPPSARGPLATVSW